MQESVESIYTIDRDMGDSIKQEYSSLPPSEQEKLTDLALETRNLIIEKYGDYISPDIKARFSTIENRVIIVNREGFKRLREDWLQDAAPKSEGNYHARLFFMGNLICITDMKEEAVEMWEAAKDVYINNGIDREIAVNSIQNILLTSALIHEFVHANWKEDFPINIIENVSVTALSECGAYYITKELLEERGINAEAVLSPIDIERAKVFAEIVSKWDVETYYVFFNYKPENMSDEDYYNVRKNILSEFDMDTFLEIGLLTKEQVDFLDKLRHITP